MVDGFANQQIVVSGNFVGNGGTVAVDAYLGGSFSCITCVDKSKSAKDLAQQQQQQQQQQIVVNVTVNGYNVLRGTPRLGRPVRPAPRVVGPVITGRRIRRCRIRGPIS